MLKTAETKQNWQAYMLPSLCSSTKTYWHSNWNSPTLPNASGEKYVLELLQVVGSVMTVPILLPEFTSAYKKEGQSTQDHK